jgi:CxxC motif-containing protein (DUF1111 family)
MRTRSERAAFVLGATLSGAFLASGVLGQQAIQPRMGDPIQGLTPAEKARFLVGGVEFNHTLTNAEGVGPILNDRACATCHAQPQAGGAGAKFVTRFGKMAQGGNPFDPLASLGGSLLQVDSEQPADCLEVVPPEADVSIHRLTTSTFGIGLTEAIADADIQFYADNPPSPDVSGIVQPVIPLEGPPTPRVGRFGWKAQQATVLSFSGDASLNEMGLTNRLVGTENAPNGDVSKLLLCDHVADPEDNVPFPNARIDKQTDFQRFLAPPPQTPRSGMTGATIFDAIGCADCHISTPYVTTVVAEAALSNKSIVPYSDFLLHDMGDLGDGIVQGLGTEHEMKTAPLWGVRARSKIALLHDASATGGTPDENVAAAIAAHLGGGTPSEGAPSAVAYGLLSSADKQRLLDFMNSLGRLEFDHDGNNNVEAVDWVLFEFDGDFTGPGSFFTPDSPAAVADFDQDGDFDLKDFGVLQRAMTGS